VQATRYNKHTEINSRAGHTLTSTTAVNNAKKASDHADKTLALAAQAEAALRDAYRTAQMAAELEREKAHEKLAAHDANLRSHVRRGSIPGDEEGGGGESKVQLNLPVPLRLPSAIVR